MNNREYKPKSFSGSGVLQDTVAGIPGDLIMGHAGMPTGALGVIAGLVTPDDSVDELKSFQYKSLIPGFASYRNTKRAQRLDQHYSKGARRNSAYASEKVGGLTASLVMMALGALVGGSVGTMTKKDNGALVGALSGALAGGVAGVGSSGIGWLSGLFNPKSEEEHEKYLSDRNLVLKNLLIPGRAGYQSGRRFRSMISESI